MTHRDSTVKPSRPPARGGQPQPALSASPRPSALLAARVSPAWVEDLLGYEGLCVVDVCVRTGPVSFPALSGYIPGAIALDVDALLSATKARPPIGVIEFAGAMASHGIDSDHYVVVVDETGRGRAERLVWALQRFGHAAAAVMDGGFARWLAEGRRVSPASSSPRPASFTARQARPRGGPNGPSADRAPRSPG
jgi:3-mercaptopyruvate sulfurtransferase SseA